MRHLSGPVSTHHHLFQSILKGVRSGINLPLMGWLRSVPHAYWSKIGEEELYIAARIGLVELLLSGTTTAADHHYMFSDTYRFDPADVIFEAARELGLRLVFCRGGATVFRTFDTPGFKPMPTEPLDAMIKSVEACAQRYHDPSPASMRRVAFAPTAPPWAVAPHELKIIAAAARGLGLRLHSHMSETTDYVDYCLATHRKRPIHWIAEHDWLGPDVAHPSRHQGRGGDHRRGRGAVATINGARVLGFDDIGVLAPGKLADLAMFDLASPRYFGLHDPLIGPVTGAGTADLKMLMVGGKVVVENGAIPGFDVDQLRRDAAAVVTRLAN